jgi:hypothetical protein
MKPVSSKIPYRSFDHSATKIFAGLPNLSAVELRFFRKVNGSEVKSPCSKCHQTFFFFVTDEEAKLA